MMNFKIFLKRTFIVLALFCGLKAEAGYYGRFISGGFFSKEVFRSSQFDRYNDVAILSERLYVNFDKIQDSNAEFTVDLRDRENFFDKLDKERLKLTGRNRLQLHQFNLHNGSGNEGFDYSLGRFPLSEAGAIYLDGLDFGIRKNLFGIGSKFSLFYGLNPQLVEDAQIKISKNLKAYGGYWILENKGQDWESYLYSTTSLVRQVYKSELDRFYFFNNTNLQSANGQNFSSILYLDLHPKVYIQNLWTTYAVNLENKYKLRTSLSTIDSLHYERNQDVRETLPSSRYHQASTSLRSPSTYNQTSYETKFTFGYREVDNKYMGELKLGSFFPMVFKDEISASLNLKLKKNFVSNDVGFGGGILHSNKFREIAFNQDVLFEKKKIETLNYAFITEGSYTKFFSRSLFGIASIQNTWDRRVSIFSVLFKLSYRFGEGGQAPIRDGSPPMGQL